MSRQPRHRAFVLATLAPFALAACTGPDAPTPSPTPDASVPASPPPTAASPTASPSADGSPASAAPAGEASTLGVPQDVVERVRAVCAPGPGKTVEDLPDIPIPAVDVEGTSVPACPAGAILRVARGFCEYVRVAHAQESEKMRET